MLSLDNLLFLQNSLKAGSVILPVLESLREFKTLSIFSIG